MRDALSNPFQPGSDVVPEIWAGRTEQLSDWRDVLRPRLQAGLFERGRTILGEPGLGKSSLVRRIAAQAERDGDWVTPQIRLALGTDPVKRIATEVLRLAEMAGLPAARENRITALLDRVQSVAASGVSVGLRDRVGVEPHIALTELLVEIGYAAIRQGAVVLIHVDEVQNITDESLLSQILISLGDAITREVDVDVPAVGVVTRSLPIAVYLTGLTEFDDRSGARKGATFARRFATTTLEPIGDDDLRSALRPLIVSGWELPSPAGEMRVVRLAPDAAETIVDVCRGEPFLFQLAGQRAWYAGDGDVITRGDVLTGWRQAQPEAVSHVERILERLPQREREFVTAMAELPPRDRSQGQIAARAGFAKATDAGTPSQRLDRVRGIIGRGKVYTFRHRAIEAFLTSDWPAIGERPPR
ncbi:AAA family ATPase [Microbacterium sp. LMI1-1-1.1]|uniref:AAA family ATPase n=1 Tax=Microbacterium sp. LMI1-1-1.1 TaxID=3135223 RepID=UPI003465575B